MGAARPAKDDPDRRRGDPERTREAILAAARDEFAEHGLSGARVDAIAARTNTVKRMIYYYFGSKQGLYLAVLERAYADIRTEESNLELDLLGPVEAIRRLVEFTFDYDEAHPEFIRLVATENIHHARHIAQSAQIRQLNQGTIAILEGVLERGKRQGIFRPDADPFDIHLMISSFCFFRVANRHTFGVVFGRDLHDPTLRPAQKRMLAQAVLSTLGVQDEGCEQGSQAA